jgi:hypothetical protein
MFFTASHMFELSKKWSQDSEPAQHQNIDRRAAKSSE